MTMRKDYLDRMAGARQFRHFGIEPVWRPGEGDITGFCCDEVVRQFHDTRLESDGGRRVRWMRAAWDFALAQSGQGEPVIGAEPKDLRLPDMDDILRIGATIEPGVNSTLGFRAMNVYIGDSMGAPPKLLNRLMVILAQQVDKVRPEQGLEGLPGARVIRSLWANLREYEYGAGAFSATPGQIARDGNEHKVMVSKFADIVAGLETADDWYLAFEAVHPFGDGNGRSGKVLNNWLLGTLNEPVLVADYFGGGNP